MDYLDLWVNMQMVYEGDQFVSCDSKFMFGVMYELGNSTCSTNRIIGGVN